MLALLYHLAPLVTAIIALSFSAKVLLGNPVTQPLLRGATDPFYLEALRQLDLEYTADLDETAVRKIWPEESTAYGKATTTPAYSWPITLTRNVMLKVDHEAFEHTRQMLDTTPPSPHGPETTRRYRETIHLYCARNAMVYAGRDERGIDTFKSLKEFKLSKG